jgi:probable HAF family extracellular repeat protein
MKRFHVIVVAAVIAVASPPVLNGHGALRENDSHSAVDRDRPETNWQILRYPDPAPGVDKTFCYGLNDEGEAVGTYAASPTPNRAYLLSGGRYYTLHPDGATSSAAWAINSRGDIVGDYYVGSQEHGFVIRDGTFTTVDFPGHAMVHLRDINARGEIAGSSMALAVSTSPQRGFVMRRDGTLDDVLYPGAVSTVAFGINNEGDVVGEYKDGDGKAHGFLRTRAGAFTSLDFPGAISTSAGKVNGRQEVVGFYWDAQTPSVSHGFVWRRGEFRQDDYPGAVHTMTHGLNNEGDTCGMVSFSSGTLIQWGGFTHGSDDENEPR